MPRELYNGKITFADGPFDVVETHSNLFSVGLLSIRATAATAHSLHFCCFYLYFTSATIANICLPLELGIFNHPQLVILRVSRDRDNDV